MYQDMLITLSATPGLPQAQPSNQSSNLPPYTPTPSSLPTKFELSSIPPSPQNPIIPIYRSQSFPSQLSDGSPPEYRQSLRTVNSKPAYTLNFDPSTQNTLLTTVEGQKVASISFLKPRRQTITTFANPHDSDVQTLTGTGSSFTIADEEQQEEDGDHVLLQSETLSNDETDETEGVQEEVGSILLDTFVPAKETITLSSHKYFHPKGTKFTAPSGNSYRWQKSISATTPPLSPPRKGTSSSARLHSTFVLTCSPPKNRRSSGTVERKRIVGRINISDSKATLELKGGQEELSEAMFLGSAIAMLKKVELKATRQRVQRTIPQNVMQLTF
ncbi:hypothetical protein TWF281_000656 [Arthrobotrys megalospora]